ncbi:hypothetical protein ABIA24_006750 [Sinorhizobium fredii]|uniref:Shedu anti-phage system protein SduA domain-containing protein n=1 Tax=Rhizobium fredii TaxID=380 RepID=UPI0035173835
MSSEEEIFHNSRPDKTYASPAFKDYAGRKLRIANKVIDGEPGYEFAKVKDELVLRQTEGGRFQIKASFLEDDRSFRSVTIQKFTSKGNAKEYFAFGPHEMTALLKFMANIKRIYFPDDGRLNISDRDLEDLLLMTDRDGEPTGETIFTTDPRSFVICGRLAEFENERGVNERKFGCFERFRRNLLRPEVVTFDELYERARLIVDANDQASI